MPLIPLTLCPWPGTSDVASPAGTSLDPISSRPFSASPRPPPGESGSISCRSPPSRSSLVGGKLSGCLGRGPGESPGSLGGSGEVTRKPGGGMYPSPAPTLFPHGVPRDPAGSGLVGPWGPPHRFSSGSPGKGLRRPLRGGAGRVSARSFCDELDVTRAERREAPENVFPGIRHKHRDKYRYHRDMYRDPLGGKGRNRTSTSGEYFEQRDSDPRCPCGL